MGLDLHHPAFSQVFCQLQCDISQIPNGSKGMSTLWRQALAARLDHLERSLENEITSRQEAGLVENTLPSKTWCSRHCQRAQVFCFEAT